MQQRYYLHKQVRNHLKLLIRVRKYGAHVLPLGGPHAAFMRLEKQPAQIFIAQFCLLILNLHTLGPVGEGWIRSHLAVRRVGGGAATVAYARNLHSRGGSCQIKSVASPSPSHLKTC